MIRKRALVHGVVQGVGFRYTARAEASKRGLAGFARNLPDGTVEVEVEGDETGVAHMLEWLRQGPPGAIVDELQVTDVAPQDDDQFVIRH